MYKIGLGRQILSIIAKISDKSKATNRIKWGSSVNYEELERGSRYGKYLQN